METPTINKKKGKTKSVGVTPCHSACLKGANTYFQLPGSLTTIIAAIVNPLKKSKEINLEFISLNYNFFYNPSPLMSSASEGRLFVGFMASQSIGIFKTSGTRKSSFETPRPSFS